MYDSVPSSEHQLAFALVGASGVADRAMLPALAEAHGAYAHGVYSSSGARGQELADRFGLERVYGSLDDALADPVVEAVYISTTNDLHADQAIAAARAGKHVLCEKPLTTNLEAAQAMLEAATTRGVVLATCHHLSALAQMRLLHDVISAGELGDIVGMHCVTAIRYTGRPDSWRLSDTGPGTGPLFDLGSHVADIVRYLLDDEIVAVSAVGANHGITGKRVPDDVRGVMRTQMGRIVSFHVSFAVPAANGVEVVGTRGSASAAIRGAMAAGLVDAVVVRRDDSSIERVPVPQYVGPFIRTVERFVEAVRGRGSPVRDGADGARALAVVTAILVALESGRVELVPDLNGGRSGPIGPSMTSAVAE